MTHTPGPWRQDGTCVVWAAPTTGNEYLIAQMGEPGEPDQGHSAEVDANARLIAAAPDMYEALKAISECTLTSCTPCVETATRLLAKAEGWRR